MGSQWKGQGDHAYEVNRYQFQRMVDCVSNRTHQKTVLANSYKYYIAVKRRESETNTMDRITFTNLRARAEQINRELAELDVDIDASISGAHGGVSLEGEKGSRHLSRNGYMPKRELYNQLNTTLEILYEVSRQIRNPKIGG